MSAEIGGIENSERCLSDVLSTQISSSINGSKLKVRLKDQLPIFSGQLYPDRWLFICHSSGFPTGGAG
ncbi:hypothetical protein FD24_GL000813 [Lactiplantibacillus pentosus DSM 20314]|uniref:Uncharacterized protein n=1 Tax=Lactiplantibacillus pentosus DSM 20314 TaxID=1423791 RepID=A0A837R8C7_LACPE|nr:hypothetical protein FD24_GL000813 [Lactiplantibacillus pentosus DSM 20314]